MGLTSGGRHGKLHNPSLYINSQIFSKYPISSKQRSQLPYQPQVLHSQLLSVSESEEDQLHYNTLTTTIREAMDALWNLEDKLKLSTQGAIVVLLCTAFAVGGLCTAVLKKKEMEKKKKRVQMKQLVDEEDTTDRNGAKSGSGWGSIEAALIGSVRWSGVSKVEVGETQASMSWREGTHASLLVGGSYEWESHNSVSKVWQSHNSVSMVWQSHKSVSPVWQKPILMGEKCELPRFSGLILYDERGRPLHHDPSEKEIRLQEKSEVVTLKDLL